MSVKFGFNVNQICTFKLTEIGLLNFVKARIVHTIQKPNNKRKNVQIRFNCIEANELIVKLIESIQNVYLVTKRTRAVVNFICFFQGCHDAINLISFLYF